MPERKQNILDFDWAFFFYWLMATAFGWVLGWLLLPTLAVVTAGVGAGVVQSVVLYRRLPRAWTWAVVTTAGWLVGVGIATLTVPPGIGLVSGAVVGTTTGMAQWSLLQPRVRWAGWWIAISGLAWATAFSLAPGGGEIALPPILMAAVLAAVLTGLAMELLQQHPKKRPDQARGRPREATGREDSAEK